MSGVSSRRALFIFGGAAAYVGAAQIGFGVELLHGTVSTVWIPAGLSLALLLLGGRGLWPAILIGETLANVLHGSGAGTSLAFGIGDVLEAVVAYEFLMWLDFRPELDRARDVLLLLLPAALLPTLLGATVGTAAVVVGSGAPESTAWLTWHTWWLGDATGIIVVTPLILAFWTRGFSIPTGWRAIETTAFVLTLVPIGLAAAGHAPDMALVSLPVLIWAALRFGQRGAAAANAVVAAAGIALVNGHSVHGVSMIHRLLITEFFIEVAAITTLVLAAVMTERQQALQELRASNQAALALAQERQRLSEFATAIARETPVAELFDLAVHAASSLLGASRSAILRETGFGRFATLAHWSADGERIQARELDELGGQRAAINVHGVEWGFLWIDDAADPCAAKATQERFATLLGMAVANTEAHQTLLNLASTDALTGLANHRAFHERLAEELARCRRYGRPVAVAIIDVDNFKQINDALGHKAGDEVLAVIAARISAVMRSEALIARIGGDELAVIMPESDAETAAAAVDRAREAVAAEPVYELTSVTLSAGVCDSDRAGLPERLIELADAALYSAKAAGRNACVTHAG